MPYTMKVDQDCKPYFEAPAHNGGDLTFQLTSVVQAYLIEHWPMGIRYQAILEITGALAQCQRDFDERVTEPYEARKRVENGDVWQPLVAAGIVPTPA
jgi:hypothetical protein